MAQGIGQHRYQHFYYRAFTVGLSILLVSETVAANASISKIAQQQPAANSPSRNSQAYKQKEKLIDEAQ